MALPTGPPIQSTGPPRTDAGVGIGLKKGGFRNLTKRQLNEISLLALSLSSNVMQDYLDNKDQIDRKLKLKVH